tara:strand:+ start:956 stop:1540 length:585 start_codon:yes stop_codon:yes gene_type:complete
MAKRNLYQAAMKSGQSSSRYSSYLMEASKVGDELSFIKRKSDFETEKFGKLAGLISSGLELTSTLYGGYKDAEEFKSKVKALEGQYGKMSKSDLSFLDKLKGKEFEYTFGEGDSAKTFSKAGVITQGGLALGEFELKNNFSKPTLLKEATGGDYKSTITWSQMEEKDRSKFLDLYPEGTESNLFSFINKYKFSE